jgi:general secretion pathway protein D
MSRPIRWIQVGAVLMVSSLLAGCGAQRVHREGLRDLDAGRWEAGLHKLEEAARRDSRNLTFRAHLLTKREQIVAQMLTKADRHYVDGRLDEAEQLYRRAAAIDSTNRRAQAGMNAVARDRRHRERVEEARALLKRGDAEAALEKLQTVLMENPDQRQAKALVRQIDGMQVSRAMAEPRLRIRGRRAVTLQFRDANIKMVFEALSKTSDINFILDKDVRPDLKTTIFVQQVSVIDAIDLILSQNQLAKKVLSENSVFVYPNTPAKTKEYQDQVIKTFYLTNADVKQAMNMLKVVLNSKVVFTDEKSNLITIRDTPETVRMAAKLIASLDLPEPEVMMEVEVLEIKRSKLKQLGIDYPDRLTLSAAGATPGSLTLDELRDLRRGDVSVSPMSIAIDIKKDVSDINILASPRIRARNRENARILIGDRVPVITSTVTPTTTGTSVITGNVQYVDVGLKLEVEPSVHLDDDVAIKINLEVSSIVREITTASGTVAYQIGTRNASTLLRLRDGETQVLAGLISDEEREAASKIPGLGDLPLLGRLFSTHKDETQKTEIVLSITPRLVRNLERPEADVVEFWYGTEANPRTQPLAVESITPAASAPAPATPRRVAPAGLVPAPEGLSVPVAPMPNAVVGEGTEAAASP